MSQKSDSPYNNVQSDQPSNVDHSGDPKSGTSSNPAPR